MIRQRSLVQVQLGPLSRIGGLVKKLIQFAAVLIGTSLAGILVWRKVETDRLHNDRWAEAERISAEQEAQTVQQTQASPAEQVWPAVTAVTWRRAPRGLGAIGSASALQAEG